MSTNIDLEASTENRRTSANSRVNFSKLTPDEKEQRCLNLAKEVKELRRQLKKRTEAERGRSKCALSGLSDRTSQAVEAFVRAQVTIRESNVPIDDMNFVLENLCRLIASDRLHPNSLAFNKICTVVRSLLSEDERSLTNGQIGEEGA